MGVQTRKETLISSCGLECREMLNAYCKTLYLQSVNSSTCNLSSDLVVINKLSQLQLTLVAIILVSLYYDCN
jgi:hypothetical protein